MALVAGACSQQPQQPNIVFIYADDMGIGDLGCYGQKYILTPNIDSMARQGMLFTNHYSGSAVSSPSRSCLMTGQHSGHTYVRGNFEVSSENPLEEGQMPLPESCVNIASMLHSAGYATGCFGKWGLGSIASSGAPLSQGFDTFYGYADQRHAHSHYPTYLIKDDSLVQLDNPPIPRNEQIDDWYDGDTTVFAKYRGREYSLDLMIDEAQKFIVEHTDGPFFAYIPVIVPHRALQVPEEEVERYRGCFEEEPYLGQDKFLPCQYPKSTYAGMISRLDSKVGEILHLLDSLGLSDHTLVLFSSDNGPCSIGGADTEFFNSSMGLSEGKRSLKEGGIRAPLVAYWPGKVPAGKTSDLLCCQYDFLATFAQMAGLKAPEDTDGISLLPTLLGRDNEQVHHQFLYWEYLEKGGQQAVRYDHYKAYRKGLSGGGDVPWELYDLTIDSSESHDIASNHPEIVAKIDSIALQEHTPAVIDAWNFVPTKQ